MKDTRLGVILAGGQSRRFGSPKPFAEKGGFPFFSYSIHAVQPFTASQMIIAHPELKDEFHKKDPSIKVITDHPAYQGKGPLAGIYTAMETEKAEWYLTVPVDVPFIETRVFENLLTYTAKDIDAVIPVVFGKQHPLIAIYHYSIKRKVKENLDKDKLSVRQLLERIRVKYVPVDNEKPFININRQTDYEQFIKKEG